MSKASDPAFPAPIFVTGSNNTVNAPSGVGMTIQQHVLLSVYCSLIQKHGRDAESIDAIILADRILPAILNPPEGT